MHNRHHYYNHIHTLSWGAQSFAFVDDSVLEFSSYKLDQNDAGFHTGSKSCGRQDTSGFSACERLRRLSQMKFTCSSASVTEESVSCHAFSE